MYKKINKLTEHHEEIVRNVIAVGKMQRKYREKNTFFRGKTRCYRQGEIQGMLQNCCYTYRGVMGED